MPFTSTESVARSPLGYEDDYLVNDVFSTKSITSRLMKQKVHEEETQRFTSEPPDNLAEYQQDSQRYSKLMAAAQGYDSFRDDDEEQSEEDEEEGRDRKSSQQNIYDLRRINSAQKHDVVEDSKNDDEIMIDSSNDGSVQFVGADALDAVDKRFANLMDRLYVTPKPEVSDELGSARTMEANAMLVELDRLGFDLAVYITRMTGLPDDEWVEEAVRLQTERDVSEAFWKLINMMDDDVTRALIKGDLPEQYHLNPNIKKRVDRHQAYAVGHNQPAVYVNYICKKKTGKAPTPQEILRVLDAMHDYLIFPQTPESLKVAIRIDTALNPSSKSWCTLNTQRGLRKYAHGFDWEGVGKGKVKVLRKSEHRYRTIAYFMSQCRLRIQYTPANMMNKPIEGGICEVGYAQDPRQRIIQHKKQTSSNYVMNLFDAVCSRELTDYKLEGFVPLRIPNVMFCAYAEIMISRMTSAYVTKGGGFSHHSAGLAVTLDDKFPTPMWNMWEEEVADAEFEQRCKADLEKEKARDARGIEAKKELAELQAQIAANEEEIQTYIIANLSDADVAKAIEIGEDQRQRVARGLSELATIREEVKVETVESDELEGDGVEILERSQDDNLGAMYD